MREENVLKLKKSDIKGEYFKALEAHFYENDRDFVYEKLEGELEGSVKLESETVLKTPEMIKYILKRAVKRHELAHTRRGFKKLENHCFDPFYERNLPLCRKLAKNRDYALLDPDDKEEIRTRLVYLAKKNKLPIDCMADLFCAGGEKLLVSCQKNNGELPFVIFAISLLSSFICAVLSKSFALLPIGFVYFFCIGAYFAYCIKKPLSSIPLPCKKASENFRLLIVISASGNSPFAVLDKCEAVLSSCELENVFVAAVVSPEISLCLNGHADENFQNGTLDRAKALSQKYKERFCLFIKKRQYEPKKHYYYPCHDRFEDIYDLLSKEKSDKFCCLYNENAAREAQIVLSLPFGMSLEKSDAENIIRSFSRNLKALRICPEYGSSPSPFAKSYERARNQEKEHFGCTLSSLIACEDSAYAFRCSDVVESGLGSISYDSCSEKLPCIKARVCGRSLPKVLPISELCLQSRRLMFLLNGISSPEKSITQRRGVCAFILLSPFFAFLFFLLSVFGKQSGVYIFMALSLSCLAPVCSAIKRIKHCEKSGALKAIFEIWELCFDIWSAIVSLPFYFTVCCYLLVKKSFFPFSFPLCKGIHEDSKGVMAVYLLSCLLFGSIFFFFDNNLARKLLGLLWLCAPVVIGVIYTAMHFIKEKSSHFAENES